MEQRFYDMVATELQKQILQPGLWARAYTEADGDQRRARAAYIRLRAEELAESDSRGRTARQESRRHQCREDERRPPDEMRSQGSGDSVAPDTSLDRTTWFLIGLTVLMILGTIVLLSVLGAK